MKFGILVAPGPDALSEVRNAEAVGFDSAFFVDSPVIFGDPYVYMAAAAVQTKSITLSVGVTNPLTRSAPVTACSLASLNALAPGRIAVGIGIGFTATMAMGQRQARLSELEKYVADLRLLLAGEVAEVNLFGESVFVQFLSQQGPWVNLSDHIPIYVAASGPRGLRLAGRIADAIILGGITQLDVIDTCLTYVDEGARSVGRTAADIEVAITPSVYVTDTEPDVEHLRDVIGPKSLAPALNFSHIAALSDKVPDNVKREWARVREAYSPKPTQDEDPRKRHLKAFRSYMTELEEWQRALVTESVLEGTSIAGTEEQCARKISLLEHHGIGHILLSPLPRYVEPTIKAYGDRILPRFQAVRPG